MLVPICFPRYIHIDCLSTVLVLCVAVCSLVSSMSSSLPIFLFGEVAFRGLLMSPCCRSDTTDSQSVFSWGKNDCGQCGHGYKTSAQVLPIRIDALEGQAIVQVAAGKKHVLALRGTLRCFSLASHCAMWITVCLHALVDASTSSPPHFMCAVPQ